MATTKLGTWKVEDQEQATINTAKALYKVEYDKHKDAADGADEKHIAPQELIQFFALFPFYKLQTKNLFDKLSVRFKELKEEIKKKDVSLYTAEDNDPTPTLVEGGGEKMGPLAWEDGADPKVNFVGSIFGGEPEYPLCEKIFNHALGKYQAINEVTVYSEISKTDYAIHLEYKLCDLYNSMVATKHKQDQSSKTGTDKEDAKVAGAEEVLSQWATNKLESLGKSVKVIIATSDEAAAAIIGRIASGNFLDKSEEDNERAETRGNFTIQYY